MTRIDYERHDVNPLRTSFWRSDSGGFAQMTFWLAAFLAAGLVLLLLAAAFT